ncbi:MAG: VOC family protein [Planctomycetes bacterium]|nr:VOC family protein [Planctomycetota bacterium]
MAMLKEGMWCHVEIPVRDVERAKRFYGDIFNWKFNDVPALQYTLFETGEGSLGGGLFTPPPEVPHQIVNYILVDSIEPVMQRIQIRGGRTIKDKTEIPGTGWYALVTDPDGNVFGLWKTARLPAPVDEPHRPSQKTASRAQAKKRPAKPSPKKRPVARTAPGKKAAKKGGAGKTRGGTKKPAKSAGKTKPAKRAARKPAPKAKGKGRR